jgi:YfiH family protein
MSSKVLESIEGTFPEGFEAYLLRDVDQFHVLPYPVTQAARQMHGADSQVVTDSSQVIGPEVDAFISKLPNHFVGVRMADCGAILLADPVTGVYAAIHSGWKGTRTEIVPKTIARMQKEFGVKPANLKAWIGPLACVLEYEVGADFNNYFDSKYLEEKNGKWFFDNRLAITDQLIKTGVKPGSITTDTRCTLTDEELPSARRQGTSTGKRMLAVITKVN